MEDAIDPASAAPPASGHGSRVSMVVAGEPAHAFLSDAGNQSIVVVHLEEGSVEGALPLNFAPGALAWAGLGGEHEEHAHEEDHDHEHGHEH